MLLILAPGPLKHSFVKEGLEYYLKLLSRWLKIETKFPQIKSSFSSKKERLRVEAHILLNHVPRGGFLVVLDERGESLSTRDFAGLIERQLIYGKKITFLIGGPEGLSQELRESADFVWKLSDLTLNHELVLLIVAEALYRAVSIIKGHPYHRD